MSENNVQKPEGGFNDDQWFVHDDQAREYVGNAIASLGTLMRTTLGPEGREKLILTESPEGQFETVLTSDAGVAIDAIQRGDGFNHPVTALFVDAMDSMSRRLGDGTSTAIVLGSHLFTQGLDLIERGLHPTNVILGYSMAATRAGRFLDSYGRQVAVDDQNVLRDVAATSITANVSEPSRRSYARMVARAIQVLSQRKSDRGLNTDDIKIIVTTGNVKTRVHTGLIVRRWPKGEEEIDIGDTEFDWSIQTKPIRNAGLAIMDRDVNFERTKTSFGDGEDAGVLLQSKRGLGRYRSELDKRHREAASDIQQMGVDVFVNQERLNDDVRRAFEKEDILVVDKVDTPLSDVYRLARSANANVVSRLQDITPERLGHVGRVHERRVGSEKWTIFDDASNDVLTIVANVPVESRIEQHRRILENAVSVTRVCALDKQVVPGAGASMMAIAADLKQYARRISEKEQLAIMGFVRAFENFVADLAQNRGHDPAISLTVLRSKHAESDGPASFGIGPTQDEPIDAWEEGIIEPRRIVSQATETALSATRKLLTVDAVVYPGVDLGNYSPQAEHD